MPHALPARQVAGNKTGPVRRERNKHRQVEPKGAREEYSEALRNKCRKGALHRKPADISHCPECGSVGTVVTRLGFSKRLAAKWYQTCTHTVKNYDGSPVKCTYFKVPLQPLVPKNQVAAIERQRTADLTARAAAKAQREADRAQREADRKPGNPDVQLRLAVATKALEEAVAEAKAAQQLVQQDDECGWESTPPPQPSSSRMTLDVANNSSATSVRTSTSQTQLECDREVAINLQKSLWDAETDATPESTKTANTLSNAPASQSTSQSTDRHSGPPARPANTSNRMRQAACLQQQAADWLGEASVTSKATTKDVVTAQSSSPIDTPTPAARLRHLRPFPLPTALDFNKLDDEGPKRAHANGEGAGGQVKCKTGSEKHSERGNEVTNPENRADSWVAREANTVLHQRGRSPSFTETPPPSTQPRSSNNILQKRCRAPSIASVISISSDEPPRPKAKHQRANPTVQVKREVVDEVLTATRTQSNGSGTRGDAAKTPSKPKPCPVRKSNGDVVRTPRVAEHTEREAVTAGQATNASLTTHPSAVHGSRARHMDAVATTSLAQLCDGVFHMRKPQCAPPGPDHHGAPISGVRDPDASQAARPHQHIRAPSSDPAPSSDLDNVPGQSTLGSSNKENYDVEPASHGPSPACTPSLDPSHFDKPGDEDQDLPALQPSNHSDDALAPLARARHLRALPRSQSRLRTTSHGPGVNMLYDPSCRLACCMMVEEMETGRAPWDSDDEWDDDKLVPPSTRKQGVAGSASHQSAQGHTSDGDSVPTGLLAETKGDAKHANDEDASEVDDMFSGDGESGDESGFDAHDGVGQISEIGSDASEDPDLDDVAEDGRTLYVEESVDAAVQTPWTHNLDEAEVWYCTVFIWTVNGGRPRRVLLSMNTGETEVRLSDRPAIYTALGGLRVHTFLVWNFTSSTWVGHDFTTMFTVSEFDQHTLLVRLPEVTRCLEFGKAITHAEEPLWPAYTCGEDDGIDSTPIAGTSKEDQDGGAFRKMSRKGKEVARD
ncbi:hypothetical protein C8T65DRAFT_740285 [Cerioporus squamosus]|nr:hypothetical protein C8T65DRAFT_740285 [Cerioporus squamosus]